MSIDFNTKLRLLHQAWPPHAIITTAALRAKGFSDQLIQKYCHSGWLRRIETGAFIRQHERATWQGGLYAIQHDLKKNIHIGGLTALALSGLAHYLGASLEENIYLYNTSSTRAKLPHWFQYFSKEVVLTYTQCHLFNEELGLKTQTLEGVSIIASEPERAILEVLYLVPGIISVEHAANLVENLQMIRPDLMQHLLEECRHILVKRLFLCLADLSQLPVLNHLQVNKVTLGKGDRTVNPGGKYFSKYKLIVAYDGSGDEEEMNV
jgi:predicted transcriptional regulator of viral defense system